MREQDGNTFGMKVGMPKKGKKKAAVKSKANFKTGGMYTSGRAIPVAPTNKKSSKKVGQMTPGKPGGNKNKGRYGS